MSRVNLYLDACCLNRPFDDQTQTRIRLESEAVLAILERIEKREWRWISSDALRFELEQTPNSERRRYLRLVLAAVESSHPVAAREVSRALELAKKGFGAMDALHLACAEYAGADIFLTTDDRLRRAAARASELLRVRVVNPLPWLTETLYRRDTRIDDVE